MAVLYWDDGVTIATYSATTKNDKTTVRVELSVSDPYDLGSLLKQLAEAKKAQAEKRAPRAKKPKPLMLTDRRGLDPDIDI
jgi:hypothetical protein